MNPCRFHPPEARTRRWRRGGFPAAIVGVFRIKGNDSRLWEEWGRGLEACPSLVERKPCAQVKRVEPRGFEPLTSALQRQRSTN
jgi:hypothetical protein